jgi:hypothetical protein
VTASTVLTVLTTRTTRLTAAPGGGCVWLPEPAVSGFAQPAGPAHRPLDGGPHGRSGADHP